MHAAVMELRVKILRKDSPVTKGAMMETKSMPMTAPTPARHRPAVTDKSKRAKAAMMETGSILMGVVTPVFLGAAVMALYARI